MSKPLIAYCYASGKIVFGYAIPVGAIKIAHGTPRTVRRNIEATARLAYDGTTLLVPGVPEAPNQTVGLNMLALHLRWLKRLESLEFVVATHERPLPKSHRSVKRLLALANAEHGAA